MKVPASIRRLYEDQRAKNERLKAEVDSLVLGIKHPRWHYESRLKQLQSFALKVESGRFTEPQALEDFFACTIVVANFAQVSDAERLIRERFRVDYRRPEKVDSTHKPPSDFPFDDLRLYVKLAEDPSRPPSDITSILFEVQIKTFLQHAWAIATHDLVYKTDDVNWSKQRIAYQTKAMLEHAEVSIQEAERLASCAFLAKQDGRTTEAKEAIALLKRHWAADELPVDIRRLADNILTLIRAVRIDLPRLEKVLTNGRAALGGAHPSNLSPFATVIQYLLNGERDSMVRLLQDDPTKKRRPLHVLMAAEIDIPAGIDCTLWRSAITLR